RLDTDDNSTFIGALDLSGFQDYKTNSFEQLLYNYSNERLINFVAERIFKERHSDMQAESIPSYETRYPGNAGSLKLLKNAEADSVLSILNDQSIHPNLKKPDQALSEALESKLSTNPHYVAPSKKSKGITFSVKHYAGPVEYDLTGFIEKNSDSVSSDFITMFRGNGADVPPTSNIFIGTLFSGKGLELNYHPRNHAVVASAQMSKVPLRHPSLKRKKDSGKADGGENLTVAQAFDSTLGELFETLSETVPWFVFCIKPNEDLEAGLFDDRTVKAQLEYMNIPQMSQSRSRSDYTTSYYFEDFKMRYRVIMDPMNLDMTKGTKALCRDFITASNWTNKEMALGSSKVFLSEASWRSLEDELRTIEDALKEENKAKKRAAGGRPSVAGSRAGDFYDGDSVYSSEGGYYDDDGSYAGDDNESHYGSEFKFGANGPFGIAPSKLGDVEMGNMGGNRSIPAVSSKLGEVTTIDPLAPSDPTLPRKKKMSRARCQWLCITWSLTWCCPTFILWLSGKKRPDVLMAWREKVALCIIIFLMCCLLLFFIIVFGKLICPRQMVYSKFEMAGFTDVNNLWVYAYGRVYQINDVVRNHLSSYNVQKYQWQDFVGADVGGYFYKAPLFDRYCPGLPRPPPAWDNWPSVRPPLNRTTYPYHSAVDPNTGEPRLYLEFMNQYAKARVAWRLDYVAQMASQNTKLIVIYDNVYDVSAYFNAGNNFFGDNLTFLLSNFYGKDATKQWEQLIRDEGREAAARYLNCMNNMFYIGTIDRRFDFRCQFSNYILLAATIVLVLVIGVKFLAALQFGSAKEPEDHDKFVICQVPCYTEGPENLTKTLESLALLRYDDKRKLL
ncbi:hypothetical protein HDV05_008268, partial [Chytridiales sp. JEL 0842]